MEQVLFRLASEKKQKLKIIAVTSKKSLSQLLGEIVENFLEIKGGN